MRKPQVVKLNKAVAQTAFLLGDVCPCRQNISGLTLVLSRCKKDGEEFEFEPLSIDEHGYVLFEWGKKLNCLENGFYIGTFYYQCKECAKLFFEIGDRSCDVQDVIHHQKNGCDDECQDEQDCITPYVDYKPAYTVERGV